MNSLFSFYPDCPWTAGWRIRSGPEDETPFETGVDCGTVTQPGAPWIVRLCDGSTPSAVRLVACGLSLDGGARSREKRVRLLATSPCVLTGTFANLPPPALEYGGRMLRGENGSCTINTDSGFVCLLTRGSRFALAGRGTSADFALDAADNALKQDFDALVTERSADRQYVERLFSINTRHNPPVALAAETLEGCLRAPRGMLKGLWSASEGPDGEAFSLNDLFPLVRAWCLIRPQVALELTLTALRLQRSDGSLPAQASPGGASVTTAPWPMLACAFEQAWRHHPDRPVLQRSLPALRKYLQWAMRYFDPHRDGIPSWQSDAEVLVPGSFERGKATPDLTALLLEETHALLRLLEEENPSAEVSLLTDEKNRLRDTLDRIFWNAQQKAFCQIWKDGHFREEASFASFVPLLVSTLTPEQQTALIEGVEETRGFPGSRPGGGWKKGGFDESTGLTAIHLFLAYEALQRSDAGRPLLRLFTTRLRESFATWFERQSIEALRARETTRPVYAMSPLTAALTLTVQDQFQRDARRAPTPAQALTRAGQRLRANRTDLLIVTVFLILILAAHIFYRLPGEQRTEAHLAEAVLYFQQGRLSETLDLCRRYPDHPLSQLLQGHLFLLAGDPAEAASLYRSALLQYPSSPSALFALALALQMDGRFPDAVRRYNDFIDMYGDLLPFFAEEAATLRELAREEFRYPPRWRMIIARPLMQTIEP